MRVHHLNCGTWCPPARRAINGAGSLLAPGRIVCHCLLIETHDGLVLVDTGLGREDLLHPARCIGALWTALMRPKGDVRETALRQVEHLGFKGSDVRHIVVTHLDFDHAGGVPDFPGATVHVYLPEYRAAKLPLSWRERFRYKDHDWGQDTHWRTYELGGEHWFGFDSVRALSDRETEVLLVPLLGHTRGHCGVAVRTGETWLLLAGDAYFHRRELWDRNPPPGLMAYQGVMHMDKATMWQNVHRLGELARGHRQDVRIFCSHDPVEFEQFHRPEAEHLAA